MSYKIYCDGATEPINPGGASGIGCVIYKDEKLLKEYSYFIPAKSSNTNNVAEYMSFIRALKFIDEEKIKNETIDIMGDSMLCINQLNGKWQIKNGQYVKYALIAKEMLLKLNKINNISLSWIPREKNQTADNLSKKELIKNNIKITVR